MAAGRIKPINTFTPAAATAMRVHTPAMTVAVAPNIGSVLIVLARFFVRDTLVTIDTGFAIPQPLFHFLPGPARLLVKVHPGLP